MNIYELMKLPNVTFEEGLVDKLNIDDKTEFVCKDVLVNTVWELVGCMPSWRFVVRASRHVAHAVHIEKFEVFQDGEQIGKLGSTWYRRNYCVSISGGKIGDYEHQRTKDVHKAVLIAKKNFKKKDINDLLYTADSESRNVIRTAQSSMSRTVSTSFERMKHHLINFALVEKKAEFEAIVSGYPSAKEALSTWADANTELSIATDMNMAFDARKHYLVVIRGGQYIVKFADESVNIYDDGNFPDDLRGKLGLLKLIMPTQMVGNVGFRVNDNTFVLLKEEQC
jgi:hypothetical protein